ncbi:MAG: RluA family pseudouridine synthase [Acidimicrobiia bacterium]|nr:RluA family pseudouridine synthase [Acidimicrobiia bacterium]
MSEPASEAAATTRSERVPEAVAGERVDRVVALLTGLPRASVAELVAGGSVRLDGQRATTRSTRVRVGSTLEVDVPDATLAAVPGVAPEAGVAVPVVHVDEAVIVVDKPAGLVVHPGAGNPTGTMVAGLLDRFPELAGVGDPSRPGLVHRLDSGTSGLLVVARTEDAYADLVAQLATRSVERRYWALVVGLPEPATGVVDAPLGRSSRTPTRMAVSAAGRPARTAYQVDAAFTDPAPAAEVSCRLETGRTHQIRVHLAAIGHPVVGDRRYGGERPPLTAPRPCLHARHLAFCHPVSGERVAFESPLPPDLVQVRAGLS